MANKYANQSKVPQQREWVKEKIKHTVRKCVCKITKNTRAEMEQVAKEKSEKYGIDFRVYCCKRCGKYHMTKGDVHEDFMA